MRCALFPISYSVLETASGYGFGERRVRPLCHLMVSPADLTGNINSAAAAGLQMWESRMRFPSLALAKRHLQARPLASAGGR